MKLQVIMMAIMIARSGFTQHPVDMSESAHVPILVKSLSYDSKLKGSNLMILARNDDNTNKSQATSQFSGKSVKSGALQIFDGVYSGKSNLQSIIDNLDVHLIYLCNDLTDAQVKDITTLCNQKGILTMTGVSKFVQDGMASFTVINENNKPKVLLNKQKMRSEGHFFSASFLQLCKIVD